MLETGQCVKRECESERERERGGGVEERGGGWRWLFSVCPGCELFKGSQWSQRVPFVLSFGPLA